MRPQPHAVALCGRPSARLVSACVPLAIVLCHSPAFAQLTTGTISGTVVDQTKAALPGSEVNVRNLGTGLTRTVFANENGRFEAPNLPVGTYQVTAALQGFGTAVRRDLQLTVPSSSTSRCRSPPCRRKWSSRARRRWSK